MPLGRGAATTGAEASCTSRTLIALSVIATGPKKVQKATVKAAAAEQWSQLVREEPATGTHSARAAFWGARVYSELKQDSQ